MLPISYMSNTNITLIRPLYLTEEHKIINASKNMPILKSKCPADKDSKRKDIKELVENSIDAGATAITVEIERGGVTYMRVTDNGCGIAKDQIKTAFLLNKLAFNINILKLVKKHAFHEAYNFNICFF